MNNKEKMKNVYAEIHASDALFRKVMEMNKKESKFRSVMKYAVTAVAGVAVMFAATNGVCYAATGESLASRISFYINGEEQDVDVTWHQDEEGVYGEFEATVEEGDDVYFEITDSLEGDVLPDGEQTDLTVNGTEAIEGDYLLGEQSEINPVIEEADGKVYLKMEGVIADITEDFADGSASGILECATGTYNYTITGTVEEFSIQVTY